MPPKRTPQPNSSGIKKLMKDPKSSTTEKKDTVEKVNDDHPAMDDPERSQMFNIRSLFTSDIDTKNLEQSNNGGIYVGRIHKIKGPSPANGSTVVHVGISNDSECLVQLSAWGDLADRLISVVRLGKVILCKGLEVVHKSKLGNFYFGNADMALKMNETSTINVVDYEGQDIATRTRSSELTDCTFKNLINIDGPTRIQGYVKIPFHKIEEKKSQDLICGMLTNDDLLLAVYIKGTDVPQHIHRGHKVEIIGELLPNESNDKHHLLVETLNNVRLVSNEKLSFDKIMKPFKHI